jgi:hypothetical protein
MGGRDFRWRERKKAKKGAKKAVSTSVIQPPVTVEVIKKKRKPKELKEAEEE